MRSRTRSQAVGVLLAALAAVFLALVHAPGSQAATCTILGGELDVMTADRKRVTLDSCGDLGETRCNCENVI